MFRQLLQVGLLLGHLLLNFQQLLLLTLLDGEVLGGTLTSLEGISVCFAREGVRVSKDAGSLSRFFFPDAKKCWTTYP